MKLSFWRRPGDEFPPKTDENKLLAELKKLGIMWHDLNKYFEQNIVLQNDVSRFPGILEEHPDLAHRCLEILEKRVPLGSSEVEDGVDYGTPRERGLYGIFLDTLLTTGSRATIASYGCMGC